MSYVEFPSDHKFTQFLAGLTPGRVLRDREAMFSRPERKQIRWVRAETKQAAEDALHVFSDSQMEIARESLARQEKTK